MAPYFSGLWEFGGWHYTELTKKKKTEERKEEEKRTTTSSYSVSYLTAETKTEHEEEKRSAKKETRPRPPESIFYRGATVVKKRKKRTVTRTVPTHLYTSHGVSARTLVRKTHHRPRKTTTTTTTTSYSVSYLTAETEIERVEETATKATKPKPPSTKIIPEAPESITPPPREKKEEARPRPPESILFRGAETTQKPEELVPSRYLDAWARKMVEYKLGLLSDIETVIEQAKAAGREDVVKSLTELYNTISMMPASSVYNRASMFESLLNYYNAYLKVTSSKDFVKIYSGPGGEIYYNPKTGEVYVFGNLSKEQVVQYLSFYKYKTRSYVAHPLPGGGYILTDELGNTIDVNRALSELGVKRLVTFKVTPQELNQRITEWSTRFQTSIDNLRRRVNKLIKQIEKVDIEKNPEAAAKLYAQAKQILTSGVAYYLTYDQWKKLEEFVREYEKKMSEVRKWAEQTAEAWLGWTKAVENVPIIGQPLATGLRAVTSGMMGFLYGASAALRGIPVIGEWVKQIAPGSKAYVQTLTKVLEEKYGAAGPFSVGAEVGLGVVGWIGDIEKLLGAKVEATESLRSEAAKWIGAPAATAIEIVSGVLPAIATGGAVALARAGAALGARGFVTAATSLMRAARALGRAGEYLSYIYPETYAVMAMKPIARFVATAPRTVKIRIGKTEYPEVTVTVVKTEKEETPVVTIAAKPGELKIPKSVQPFIKSITEKEGKTVIKFKSGTKIEVERGKIRVKVPSEEVPEGVTEVGTIKLPRRPPEVHVEETETGHKIVLKGEKISPEHIKVSYRLRGKVEVTGAPGHVEIVVPKKYKPVAVRETEVVLRREVPEKLKKFVEKLSKIGVVPVERVPKKVTIREVAPEEYEFVIEYEKVPVSKPGTKAERLELPLFLVIRDERGLVKFVPVHPLAARVRGKFKIPLPKGKFDIIGYFTLTPEGKLEFRPGMPVYEAREWATKFVTEIVAARGPPEGGPVTREIKHLAEIWTAPATLQNIIRLISERAAIARGIKLDVLTETLFKRALGEQYVRGLIAETAEGREAAVLKARYGLSEAEYVKLPSGETAMRIGVTKIEELPSEEVEKAVKPVTIEYTKVGETVVPFYSEGVTTGFIKSLKDVLEELLRVVAERGRLGIEVGGKKIAELEPVLERTHATKPVARKPVEKPKIKPVKVGEFVVEPKEDLIKKLRVFVRKTGLSGYELEQFIREVSRQIVENVEKRLLVPIEIRQKVLSTLESILQRYLLHSATVFGATPRFRTLEDIVEWLTRLGRRTIEAQLVREFKTRFPPETVPRPEVKPVEKPVETGRGARQVVIAEAKAETEKTAKLPDWLKELIEELRSTGITPEAEKLIEKKISEVIEKIWKELAGEPTPVRFLEILRGFSPEVNKIVRKVLDEVKRALEKYIRELLRTGRGRFRTARDIERWIRDLILTTVRRRLREELPGIARTLEGAVKGGAEEVKIVESWLGTAIKSMMLTGKTIFEIWDWVWNIGLGPVLIRTVRWGTLSEFEDAIKKWIEEIRHGEEEIEKIGFKPGISIWSRPGVEETQVSTEELSSISGYEETIPYTTTTPITITGTLPVTVTAKPSTPVVPTVPVGVRPPPPSWFPRFIEFVTGTPAALGTEIREVVIL